MQATRASYKVLGVRIDDVGTDELLDAMIGSLTSGNRLLVLHVNAWLLTLVRNHPWIVPFFNQADLVFPDSAGTQLAVRILYKVKLAPTTTADWIDDLGRRMANIDASVYWLGSKPDVIKKAALNHARASGVRVAGYHHGYFDKFPDSEANIQVVEAINRSGADILVVNMGMPIQERWLRENWRRLDVKVAFTAGALAERVAGAAPPRPPVWMRKYGLEWASRLVAEPRRLWRRYLIGLPHFGLLIARAWLSPNRETDTWQVNHADY